MSPARQPPPAPKLDVDHLEAVYGRRLPDAYRKFVATGAYQKKNGWKVHGLPGFDLAWSLPVRFDAPTPRWELEESGLGRESRNDPLITVRFRDPAFYPPSRSKKPRPVPMATLQSRSFDGQEFLAIDLSTPSGAVSLWQHGDGRFVPIADSFESFLAGLIPPDAKAPMEEAIDLHDTAQRLLSRDPKKAERVMLQGLAPFTDLRPKQMDEDTKERVAAFYNVLGISRIGLRRYPEAASAYEKARALGSGNAALNLALTWAENLGEFKKAVAVTDEILADALLRIELGKERASLVYATRGLALLGLGREQEAREAYGRAEEFLEDLKVARDLAADLELHIVKKGLPLAAVASELSARLKGIARGNIAPRRPAKAKAKTKAKKSSKQ